MKPQDFKLEFENLSDREQTEVLKILSQACSSKNYISVIKERGDLLDNKGAECPYCKGFHYRKHGSDKNSRRYMCTDCHRSFTEYTGTWIAGIHRKELIPDFLETMELELSLKKSSTKLNIDKGTVFSWRHKLLSSVQNQEKSKFTGITETDETFFLESQKGVKCKTRNPRERGGSSKRGISNEQAAVITTMDRTGNTEFTFQNMGRISMYDIENAIGKRVGKRTILCSDGHSSYKAFASLHNIEHCPLNISKGERVKGVFHIQHINSLHSRMKGFLDIERKGVSTKYLQKYLNWQRLKDMFKDEPQWVKKVLKFSLTQTDALRIFENTQKVYEKIISHTLIPT